jgi:glycosyltransferase involved in cell wall biosynthesis
MRADLKDSAAAHLLEGKRIIFVFGSLELGGAERQALILARYLSGQLRAEVEVWGFNRAGPAAALCERHGLPWRVVPFYFAGSIAGRLIRLFKLARLLRAARPDILLPYTLIPNVVCGLIWRLTGARSCVWNQRDAGIARMGRAWERCAVRLTPRFISNSRQGARFLSETLKARPHKVTVIRNGVEPTAPEMSRAAWRDHLQLDERCFVACMVANVHGYKDHETLLKAWRVVAKTFEAGGRSAILILTGRLDDAYEPLVALCGGLGISQCVIFTGHVADVAGLLGAADISVFSSRSEGCPNGVLESMAAGLAVAGTDVEGIKEAVGSAGAPYLAPPGDAEALAERILKLAVDPPLRSTLGEEHRRRVSNYYDPVRMCEETVALLVKGFSEEGL